MGGARRAKREPRKTGGSDLIPRILVAIPAIAFAAAIIYYGGWVFAVGIAQPGLDRVGACLMTF